MQKRAREWESEDKENNNGTQRDSCCDASKRICSQPASQGNDNQKESESEEKCHVFLKGSGGNTEHNFLTSVDCQSGERLNETKFKGQIFQCQENPEKSDKSVLQDSDVSFP